MIDVPVLAVRVEDALDHQRQPSLVLVHRPTIEHHHPAARPPPAFFGRRRRPV
jgi:hypothetical protein